MSYGTSLSQASLHNTINKNVPSKMTSNKTSLPWITYAIKKLIRKRDRAYKKMKKSKSPKLIKEVKDLKRQVQQCLRRAHWDHVNSLFAKHQDDLDIHQKNKRFWSYIKQQKASNVGVPPLKDNGQLITNARDKAQVLNNQFNSAFSEGRHYSDIDINTKCKLPEKKAPPIPDIKVDQAGIKKLLDSLDTSKAPGPDGVSPKILQALAPEIAPMLTTIFSCSLSTGVVPLAWKSANVSPVYKKGEHYKASNYRPISLTCICCKILEHVLVSNIMAHWEKHNVLVPNQHGFRSKRSCESQLIELMDELTKNLDDGIQTDVIVLDFAKAFDRVNHSLLCKKMESYGIDGATSSSSSSSISNAYELFTLCINCQSQEFTSVKKLGFVTFSVRIG